MYPTYLKLFADMVEGLYYLHGQKVNHGNLRPSSIQLIVSDGNFVQAKLSDFGLCEKLNFTNQVYLPPELIQDNLATDVWALGFMFYQILTGRSHAFNYNVTSIKTKLLLDYSDESLNKLLIKMLIKEPL